MIYDYKNENKSIENPKIRNTRFDYSVEGMRNSMNSLKEAKNPVDMAKTNNAKQKMLMQPGYWNQGKVGITDTKAKQEIDYSFVNDNEGGRVLNGYVPPKGKSGVTISSGIDLGQYGTDEVKRVLGNQNSSLYEKYKPYIGLKQNQAYNELVRVPLKISENEAITTEKLFRNYRLNLTKKAFERKTNVMFDSLPGNAKTVIFDLAYQNGENNMPLDVIQNIAGGNYDKAAEILESDKNYAGRNMKRAKLLKSINNWR